MRLSSERASCPKGNGLTYQCYGSRITQNGLSLIELMIAMTIGLILIAGVLSVFLASRKTYSVNTAVADVQNNGRVSLTFIRTATRMAGYMGCGDSATVKSYLKSSALPYDFAQALTGFDSTKTAPGGTYIEPAVANPAPVAASWSPALDPTLPVSGLGHVEVGSDVLVVRYSDGNVLPAYVTGDHGDNVIFDVAPTVQAGDFLLVSNCLHSFVVQADDVHGSHVTVNDGNDAVPGNQVDGLPAPQSTWTGAQTARAITTVFYIGSAPGGIPALFEAVTNAAGASGLQSQELVPDVENMQVLYGVDTTQTGTPGRYVTAQQVTDSAAWPNVVSVRVALLVRSALGAVSKPSTAPTYDLLGTAVKPRMDTRIRRVFVATIQLRNR